MRKFAAAFLLILLSPLPRTQSPDAYGCPPVYCLTIACDQSLCPCEIDWTVFEDCGNGWQQMFSGWDPSGQTQVCIPITYGCSYLILYTCTETIWACWACAGAFWLTFSCP